MNKGQLIDAVAVIANSIQQNSQTFQKVKSLAFRIHRDGAISARVSTEATLFLRSDLEEKDSLVYRDYSGKL